ncbi:hypothetical protein ScPMuIL_010689 [Solemya velum]
MKAIRVSEFGGPEVLKFESGVPVPTVHDNQVLIKVAAAGVNPVDTYIRSGAYSALPTLPYTPGMDTSGTVEEIGAKVTEFKRGDRVYTIRTASGGYAEYTTADTDFVGRLSDKLTFEQGAGLGVPYYTAFRAFSKAQIKAGETVLVHGASGAVGLACTQIGVSMGVQIIGTAGTEVGMELVRKNGATAVFNHREDGYREKIVAETGGAGPDVILEMAAHINLSHDLEIIKKYGRIVIVGGRGSLEINPRMFMGKECTLTGMALMLSPKEAWTEMHAAVQKGMADGWLQPYIRQQYPLSDAKQAQTDIMSSRGAQGKIILKT